MTELETIRVQYEAVKKKELFAFSYDIVFSALCDCICRLLIQPGTVLLETKISDAIGISRTPLKKALDMLEDLGFVQSIPGKGYVVTDIDWEEFREFGAIRKAIESCCAELAARRAKPKDLAAMGESLKAMKDVSMASNGYDYEQIRGFAEVEYGFHTAVCRASYNRFLIKAYENINHQLRRTQYYYMFKVDNISERHVNTTFFDEHYGIYHSIKMGHANLAFDSMRNHLERMIMYLPDEKANKPVQAYR